MLARTWAAPARVWAGYPWPSWETSRRTLAARRIGDRILPAQGREACGRSPAGDERGRAGPLVRHCLRQAGDLLAQRRESPDLAVGLGAARRIGDPQPGEGQGQHRWNGDQGDQQAGHSPVPWSQRRAGGALSGHGSRRDDISRMGLGHCVSALISGKCFRGNRQFSRPPWTRGASDHFPRFLSRQYLRARLRRYGLAGSSVPGQDGKSPVVAPRSTARRGRSGPGSGS